MHNTRGNTAAVQSNCNEFEDSLNITGKSVHSYIDKFVSNLEGRINVEKDRNKILATAGKLFDVDEVIKYKNSNDVRSYILKNILNLPKKQEIWITICLLKIF